MVQFAMLESPGTPHVQRSLVRMLPWNNCAASPAAVESFAKQLSRIKEPTRGVMIAPGGISLAARAAAAEVQIELVDAPKLAATIMALGQDKSDFYFTLTTVGEFTRPTCPVCQKKLKQISQPNSAPAGMRPQELVFQSSCLVSDAVLCERLEILRECEVTFLKEVRAKQMIVRGHASGDFICDGPVMLDPGATLDGTVAARSIKIHTGGQMLGQARILDASAEPLSHWDQAWFWRCDSGHAACQKVAFDPHTGLDR
jgi:hypothetical protein